MEILNINDLCILIDIDGPKVAVDLYRYFIFVWNDFSDGKIINNEIPDSYWVYFKSNESNFINFLYGNRSLYFFFKHQIIHYGYLKNDLETLVLDPKNFSFDVTEPDIDSYFIENPLPVFPIVKRNFGNPHHFSIYTTSFAYRNTNFKLKIKGNEILLSDNKFSILKQLTKVYRRLRVDNFNILKYTDSEWDNTYPNTLPFSWFYRSNKTKDQLQKILSDNDFFVIKNGNNYELISNSSLEKISQFDFDSTFKNLKFPQRPS